MQANPYRVQNSLHPCRWDERGASRHLRRVGGSEYLFGTTTHISCPCFGAGGQMRRVWDALKLVIFTILDIGFRESNLPEIHLPA